jgi:parallel beta-helix repeat protein
MQNSGNGIFIDGGASYNKIVNNTISYNSLFGICVYDSGGAPCIGNVIMRNDMQFNAWGCIEVASCSEGTKIIENKIANCKYGIDLFYCNMIHDGDYSCEATILGNVMANCKYGIAISGAHGNNITSNTVMDCTYGIRILYSTENNTVYHNNFISNVQQVNMTGVNTVWDGGYPSGGNYWSNYNVTDSDGDGIGDTPYIIDEYNRDNYPLMYPRPFMMGDVNCDCQVDIYDVTAVCIAYDSQSGDPYWYPPADIAEPYGIIDIYDVTAVCISYGKKWPH